ncbi:MAG: GMC family oxidoreductase [Acidimicrobiia bacterium]|nr:GMC family oxidoreductase [Acidimicrobiia bacterium]
MTIVAAGLLEPDTVVRAPVCVLGGGAVGIALVRELAARGVDSLLIESGGLEYDDDVQELYAGRADGYFDLRATRLRYLGGTTNHYAGQSRPLEPVDFEAHSWRGGVAWPIDRSELTAHLPAAVRTLGLADDRWDTEDWFPELVEPRDPSLQVKVFQALARPLGTAYRAELDASEHITVLLGANATQLVLAEGNEAIDHVELSTLEGLPLRAEAEAVVVATGGIESPRLLLASNRQIPEGVGNSSDMVGRYFADHPSVGPLRVVPGPREPTLPRAAVTNEDLELDVSLVATLAITEDAQRERGVTGFHAFVLPTGPPSDEDLAALGVEQLLDIGGPSASEAQSVVFGLEQVPNAESRVTLDDERDALGHPRARLDWRLTDEDEEHFAALIEQVAIELAVTGIGRMHAEPFEGSWRDQVMGQHHHMGTLRMSTSPRDGVVNEDLRFHDVRNLYAAGPAVFPTYGHVNPTLNAVALAIRLAHHLEREVG